MSQLTTNYILKAKQRKSIWTFKYALNGIITEVKFLEMGLTAKQLDWLFKDGNFPYLEEHIKAWEFDKKLFEISIEPPDLSFDSFWELYDFKRSKEVAIQRWSKLTDAERLKCFLALPAYNKDLAKTGQAKAHLKTWIHQKRFNDEY